MSDNPRRYLELAIQLSKDSVAAGEFPAGAVLVSAKGNVYKSLPSVAYNHGEMMVIDQAIEAEGFPLEGSVVYGTMEPCLMCCAKMYWAGIAQNEFIIPKHKTDVEFAFENPEDMQPQIQSFFRKLELTEHPELLDEAFPVWDKWYKEKNRLEHQGVTRAKKRADRLG